MFIKDIASMKYFIMLVVSFFFITTELTGNNENESFGKIHPLAVYMLYGENLADPGSSIIAVDYNLVKKSNYAATVTIMKSSSWIGFHCIKKDPRESFDFKYKVIKSYPNNNFLIQCVYDPIAGRGVFQAFLIIKKASIKFNDDGRFYNKNVIISRGYFTKIPKFDKLPEQLQLIDEK